MDFSNSTWKSQAAFLSRAPSQDVGHGATRETHQPQHLGDPLSRLSSARGSLAAGLFYISFTFKTRLLTSPVQYLTTPIHPHFSLPFHFVPFVAL